MPDYRGLPKCGKKFDRVVSVGMVEYVRQMLDESFFAANSLASMMKLWLAVSLFGAEGLPEGPDRIPVEMILSALNYLREKRQITDISFYGISMGTIFAALHLKETEARILLAAGTGAEMWNSAYSAEYMYDELENSDYAYGHKILYRMIPLIGIFYRRFAENRKLYIEALEQSEKEIMDWI